MEHARRLYLVDEFDRVYKQLQRPSAAVAKTHSSIQLSKTLQDNQLSEDEKVRRYVAELHRYLNISDSHTQQQQQQQQTVRKSRKRPLNVNTDRPVLAVPRRPEPARRPQLRSDQTVAQSTDDTDDDEDDEIFINLPQRSASTSAATTTATVKKVPKPKSPAAKTPSKSKRRKLDWSNWAAYKQ